MRYEITILVIFVIGYWLVACAAQPVPVTVSLEPTTAETPSVPTTTGLTISLTSTKIITTTNANTISSVDDISSTIPAPPPAKHSEDLSEMPARGPSGKPGLPNLSQILNQLLADWPAGPGVEKAVAQGLEIVDGRVKVMLIMLDEPSAEAAITALPTLGGEVTAHYQTWIDAWVPVEALEQVAHLPGVSLVREPVPVLPLK